MHSVNKQKNVQKLAEQYQTLFYEKYGKDPILGKWDREAFSWMIDQTGFEDTFNALCHYFEMKEAWFIEKAYDLETFRKQFNKILAHMGQVEKNQNDQRRIKVQDELTLLTNQLGCIKKARVSLKLDESGCDDWMVKHPYSLPKHQFEQWKDLTGWKLETARSRTKKLIGLI